MVLALAPELLLSYTPIFDVYSERGARIYSRLELLKYARLFLKNKTKLSMNLCTVGVNQHLIFPEIWVAYNIKLDIYQLKL